MIGLGIGSLRRNAALGASVGTEGGSVVNVIATYTVLASVDEKLAAPREFGRLCRWQQVCGRRANLCLAYLPRATMPPIYSFSERTRFRDSVREPHRCYT